MSEAVMREILQALTNLQAEVKGLRQDVQSVESRLEHDLMQLRAEMGDMRAEWAFLQRDESEVNH
jgi:hypothetical protein